MDDLAELDGGAVDVAGQAAQAPVEPEGEGEHDHGGAERGQHQRRPEHGDGHQRDRRRDRGLQAPGLTAERPADALGAGVRKQHDQQRRQPARDGRKRQQRQQIASLDGLRQRRHLGDEQQVERRRAVSADAAVAHDLEHARAIAAAAAQRVEDVREAVQVQAARQPREQRGEQHRDQPRRHAAGERGRDSGQHEPEHQPHERKEADRPPEIDVPQRPAPDGQARQERERGDDGLHAVTTSTGAGRSLSSTPIAAR